MSCENTCMIAGAFFIASVYTSLFVDKEGIIDPYYKLLSSINRERYEKIGNERRMIQMRGLTIGIIIGIMLMINSGRKNINMKTICDVLAITFVINYFFYLLYPKKDSMILNLDTKEERKAWWKVYKMMQFNYNSSLVLGIIGLFIILRKM